MNHTKEPWYMHKSNTGIIYGNDSVSIAAGHNHYIAQRIVKCVNACAGITNEALEAGVVHSALINFEESLELQKGEQFCFYDIPVLEEV